MVTHPHPLPTFSRDCQQPLSGSEQAQTMCCGEMTKLRNEGHGGGGGCVRVGTDGVSEHRNARSLEKRDPRGCRGRLGQ